MKDQVINNLFDKDDYIILKNIKELENGKVTFFGFPGSRSTAINVNDFSFYCVNAIKLDSDDKATNHNIATYRNFVIENDSLTKDQQLDIIERSGLPISNQVFSGNSSVHNTICLDVPLKDEETYRTWFKAITKGLSKWGYTADEACINPSRLTRMPLATHANGSEQSIISVGNRVTHNALLDWFITNDIDLDELEEKSLIRLLYKEMMMQTMTRDGKQLNVYYLHTRTWIILIYQMVKENLLDLELY